MKIFIFIFFIFFTSAISENLEKKNKLNKLFNQLEKVNNIKSAELLEKQIWTVWNKHPNDNKLSCEELSTEITKANNYADEAQKAKKTGTPHNIGAILFFLPGYGITIKNIEEATKAAKDRALHLNQLKEKIVV